MATITRVNGAVTTVGQTYNLMAKVVRIVVQNPVSTKVDLRDEDDAVDEVVEVIIRELNPLAYYIPDDNTGIIMVIMDNNVSGKDIKTRIRNLGSAVGPNSIDVTGTLVYEGNTFIDENSALNEVDA